MFSRSVRIPPEKIDEIRNATDIVDLIGAVVKLKKRGKNYLGLCPFHTEKTPSFNVSAERQMYHCFGCGVGGNAITFVMEHEKLSFVEAVTSLAEKAGIALPRPSAGDTAAATEQEEIHQICREAGLFFYNSLTEPGEGKIALDYFHQRGFTDDTIRVFGLGYSPHTWDAFLKFAAQKNLPLPLVEKAGLARRKEDGTSFDYFRGRAMFPIFSPTGRVVGFGARKLRPDDPLGKYINSPETPIYNKSKVLYGIFQSKEAIREKDFVILVEGYADLITLFQAGIKNVVASSGTALTPDQINLISRYTKNITIVYDADSAGSAAALRGVDLILERDLDVRVTSLPEGEDPDSFVNKKGGKAFQELVGGAVSFVDFIAQAYERQGKFATPEGQAQTVRTIIGTIAKMKDELKRNFYIKHVAEKYRLYESTLYRELEAIVGAKGGRREPQAQTSSGTAPRPPRAASSGEVPLVEKDLLRAMLEGGGDVVRLVFSQIALDDFSHPDARAVAAMLAARVEEGTGTDPTSVTNEIEDPAQRRLIADVVFNKYDLGRGWERQPVVPPRPEVIAMAAVSTLRRRRLERMMEENQRQMKAAGKEGKSSTPFLERHRQLLQELQALERKTGE